MGLWDLRHPSLHLPSELAEETAGRIVLDTKDPTVQAPGEHGRQECN